MSFILMSFQSSCTPRDNLGLALGNKRQGAACVRHHCPGPNQVLDTTHSTYNTAEAPRRNVKVVRVLYSRIRSVGRRASASSRCRATPTCGWCTTPGRGGSAAASPSGRYSDKNREKQRWDRKLSKRMVSCIIWGGAGA